MIIINRFFKRLNYLYKITDIKMLDEKSKQIKATEAVSSSHQRISSNLNAQSVHGKNHPPPYLWRKIFKNIF